MNRQYLDPVFMGRYPEEMREIFGEAWPEWPQQDHALIREPIDFLGVNYYTRSVVRHDETAYPLKAAAVRQKQAAYSETGWEVFPQGLTDTLVWIKQRYGDIPQYVTENGAAFYDPPAAPSRPHQRPAAHRLLPRPPARGARRDPQGVDVRGYFAWSLMDNLEWSLGFSKRFGLVHVNFETLERTPKDSAAFYSDVIASRGAALADAD